jgi:two-component system, chemotaxis family, protein-glutamate methylesterase/glutaminase
LDQGIVILAASLGGPPLINEVLSSLTEGFELPILVLQYMESDFSEPLTAAWSKSSSLDLKRLIQKEKIIEGKAYVVPFKMYPLFEEYGSDQSIKPQLIESECDVSYQWSRVIDECIKYYEEKIYLILLTDYGIQGGAFERSLQRLCECGGSVIYCTKAVEKDESHGSRLEMEIDQIVSHLQTLSDNKYFEPKEF